VRKRIVIGLLAIGAIGVVVFWVSQPKRGSLEWHKREYFALVDRMCERRPVDRALKWIQSKTGLQLPGNKGEKQLRLARKAEVHRLALIERGYITQRRFVVFNDNAVHRLLHAERLRKGNKERAYFTCRTAGGGGVLLVTGPLDDIAFFEDLIRKADVSGWGESLVPNIGGAGSVQ
jgi:hypothetical protein